ncbi:hypothetical protein ACIGEZ_13650 [Streptomyces sp. NPDC085481]|uniref:hypothetical protein n=1 Tax=Streptomyces sp. NPDC085481 TaxID=3365727 RepID=UPI0037D83FE2
MTVSPPAHLFEDADAPGHAHDPHEVTIQLDAVDLRSLGDTWSLRPAEAAPEPQREPNGPVFVDESGRRGRRFRRIGTLIGVACTVYAVVIVATLLSGNSTAPWVPVPKQEQDVPAGQDQASPSPTEPTEASPSASGTPTSSATPTGERSAAPTKVPSASASTRGPGTRAPAPSATAPKPDKTTRGPGPGPSRPGTPPPTSSAPTDDPTPKTTTSPADGAPMTLGLADPASAGYGHAPSSPENVL